MCDDDEERQPDRHTAIGNALMRAGWTQVLRDGEAEWVTEKHNLSGRTIARKGDATWRRDYALAKVRYR